MNTSVLARAASKSIVRKPAAKVASKTKVVSKAQVAKSAAKVAKAAAKERQLISLKALNAVADKLGDKFIGKNDIVSIKETKSGCEMFLTNGKTVVLSISTK